MPNPLKPSALKLVQGTYRPDRVAANEPQPQRAVPHPPRHLSARAKRLWPEISQLIDRMGVLTVADAMALEGLVETYAELIEARLALRRHGSSTIEANGLTRAHPLVGQINELDRRLKSWLSVWG